MHKWGEKKKEKKWNKESSVKFLFRLNAGCTWKDKKDFMQDYAVILLL